MKKLKILFLFFLLFFGIYFLFPYFIVVKLQPIPTSSIVYDIHNIELWEIIAEWKYRHRYTNFEDIPKFLQKSFISIEDKRFYSHHGIDYIGIIRALKNNIIWKNIQGASTLENQIIRNHYWLNEKRWYTLKIKEFIFSLALNKKYSKDEILTLYLNTINFWYLNFWVESAAKFYYHKSLNELTKAEIIWLLTIIKNPNNFNPITKLSAFNTRFKILTNSLEQQGIISKEEKNLILEEKLTFYTGEKNKLPYIVDFIQKSEKWKESKIHTTIDYYLSQKINNLAQSTLKTLSWKNVWDYSIVIINKNTMDLKVMIGGQDYEGKEGQVNATLAVRQPGSTLKPFLYALYFQDFWKNPSSPILDLPVSYPTAFWYSYEPKNYSLQYAWEITLAEALSQSINIPAVKILHEIWTEKFLSFLKNIWIYSLNRDADYYWLSLALWSWEINLYELTRAYSIFAKNGEFCEINIFQDENKNWKWNQCKFIINKKYTDMVEEILTNRYFKLAWFPIYSNLDFPDRNVFVKTGTSRNFKDNWSIWFTSNFIIWVWVGNKDGSEMLGVSGVSWAGDIFKKIVYELDDYERESSIISLHNESSDFIKIISPLANNEYQISPSIPIEKQEIHLQYSTNIDFDNIFWLVDGKIFEKPFLPVNSIKEKTSIRVEIYKDNILLGSDEVEIKRKE